jgi:hypothetical protein
MSGYRKRFTEEDKEALSPTGKVGLVATIDDKGNPHVTLITTMEPLGETELILGQFSHGLSKQYMQTRNNVAFLAMTLDRKMWRGKARWTGLKREGPEFEHLNMKPMFRYNSYFGINTVHYLDLLEVEGPDPLPMGGIIASSLKTLLFAPFRKNRQADPVLNSIARGLFDMVGSLIFLSWINEEGFPEIIPVLQCTSSDPSRLVFTPGPWGRELEAIPAGTETALFVMSMEMETVLVRGTFAGFSGIPGGRLARVDLHWVYNSLPPAHGQIYPPLELEPVRENWL